MQLVTYSETQRHRLNDVSEHNKEKFIKCNKESFQSVANQVLTNKKNYIYLHTQPDTYIHTHTHMNRHIHLHIHLQVNTKAQISNNNIHTCTCTSMCTPTQTCTHTHIDKHTSVTTKYHISRRSILIKSCKLITKLKNFSSLPTTFYQQLAFQISYAIQRMLSLK